MTSNEAKTQWTPGPWSTGEPHEAEMQAMVYCDDELGSRVADCSTSTLGKNACIANARLIAAAPELVAVIQAIDKSWTDYWPDGPDTKHANVNIAEETAVIWRAIRALLQRITQSSTVSEQVKNEAL